MISTKFEKKYLNSTKHFLNNRVENLFENISSEKAQQNNKISNVIDEKVKNFNSSSLNEKIEIYRQASERTQNPEARMKYKTKCFALSILKYSIVIAKLQNESHGFDPKRDSESLKKCHKTIENFCLENNIPRNKVSAFLNEIKTEASSYQNASSKILDDVLGNNKKDFKMSKELQKANNLVNISFREKIQARENINKIRNARVQSDEINESINSVILKTEKFVNCLKNENVSQKNVSISTTQTLKF